MKFSASMSSLLDQCVYPFRKDVNPEPIAPNDDMLLGTDVHGIIEKILIRETDIVVSESAMPYFEQWTLWFDLFRKKYKIRAMHIEEAYAIDVRSLEGRLLPSLGHRDYSDAKETEAVGTIDFLCRTMDGSWHLRDWKVATPNNIHDRKDPKRQIETQALLVCHTFNIPWIDAGYVRIHKDHWEEESWHYKISDLNTLAALTLDDHEKTPVIGPECSTCPVRFECPLLEEKSAPAKRLLDDFRENPLSPGEFPAAYAYLRVLEERARTARDTLKAELSRLGGKVVLSPGRNLVIEQKQRETLSKESILEALSPKEGEATLESFRELGAMRTTTYDVMVERNEKRK